MLWHRMSGSGARVEPDLHWAESTDVEVVEWLQLDHLDAAKCERGVGVEQIGQRARGAIGD
jgi:hypothetical protein